MLTMHAFGENESDSDFDREYDVRQVRSLAHKKRIGLAQRAHLQKVHPGSHNAGPSSADSTDTRQRKLVEYIQKNFAMKECVMFVPKGNNSNNCQCGGKQAEHYQPPNTLLSTRGDPRSPTLPGSHGSSPRSNNLVLTPKVTEQLLATTNNSRSRSNSIRVADSNSQAVSVGSAPRLPPVITVKNCDGKKENQVVETGEKGMSVSRNPSVSAMWSEADCINEFPTNAFGKVEFANDEARSKPAKYIRISDTTPIENVMDVMLKSWRIAEPHAPSLCISVIGGAKNFSLDGRKKDTFKRGLVKAAQSTNAWIITSGAHTGIMKTVGEAVREGQSMQLTNNRVTHCLRCIGIGPWGYVQNRQDLTSHDGMGLWPATYHVDPVVRHHHPLSLDPNHTHFILVDDGYKYRLGSAEFRAKLERKISGCLDGQAKKLPAVRKETLTHKNNEVCSSENFGAPVVVVLVEGGWDSISFAYESVKIGNPLVVCEGTGRAADIMAFAYHAHTHTIGGSVDSAQPMLSEVARNVLIQKLQKTYGYGRDCEAAVKKIVTMCQSENMVTIFDIDHHEEFDLAILSSLLNSKGTRPLDQLRLALKWNRSDVAEEHLFKDGTQWEAVHLHEVMQEALISNKLDFVKLLLQHGVIMKDFLSVSKLRALYNAAPNGSFLRKLMTEVAGGRTYFYLTDVHQVLEKLLESTFEPTYSLDKIESRQYDFNGKDGTGQMAGVLIDTATFPQPFRELFIWSIMIDRMPMAKFFWERGQSPVMAALIATKIYDSLTRRAYKFNHDLSHHFKTSKNLFQELAINVVNKAFTIDQEKSLLMTERPHESWANMSCMEMAATANDKKFMATSCCQMAIDQTWCRGLNLRFAAAEILFGLFCPIYTLRWLIIDTHTLGIRYRDLSMLSKLMIFYKAPVTKFVTTFISHLVFLCLFTFVVLFDFRPHRISIVEIILHVWVASIMLNEIRELSMGIGDRQFTGASSVGWRLLRVSFWCKIEWLALILHAIGFGMRMADVRVAYIDTIRIVFCLSLALFYIKMFRFYMVSSYLGPKLFLIKRMFFDVVMFITILVVFMLAYAVAYQALAFPMREFYWGIFGDILYYPYWQIYGELMLDETIQGQRSGCEEGMAKNPAGHYCPRKFWPVTLMLAAYMVVGNILLVNLLIAIFTHVFEEVQQNSNEIWKFEMWGLSTEFDNMPVLPAPFTIPENMFRIVRYKCCGKSRPSKCFQKLNAKQIENMQVFEKECMNEFLRSAAKEKSNEVQSKVHAVYEMLETLSKSSNETVREIKEKMAAINATDEQRQLPSQPAQTHARRTNLPCQTPVKRSKRTPGPDSCKPCWARSRRDFYASDMSNSNGEPSWVLMCMVPLVR